MSILSGYGKYKRYILTSEGYKLCSQWTSSNTVEMGDGNTAETNLGSIKGITDSLTATSSNIALSASAGNNLQTQFNTLNSNFINIGDIRSGVNTSNMGTNAGAYRNISSVMLPPGKWLIQYCVQIDATSSDCRRISCINRIKDSFSDITTKNITQQNGIVIVDNTETTSYVLQIYTSIASNIQAGYGQIKAIRVI